jgi:hypothetical protein
VEDKKGTILMAALCIQTKQCQHQGGGGAAEMSLYNRYQEGQVPKSWP